MLLKKNNNPYLPITTHHDMFPNTQKNPNK